MSATPNLIEKLPGLQVVDSGWQSSPSAQIKELAWPTRKTESWKYSAKHLAKLNFEAVAIEETTASQSTDLLCIENGVVTQTPNLPGISVRSVSASDPTLENLALQHKISAFEDSDGTNSILPFARVLQAGVKSIVEIEVKGNPGEVKIENIQNAQGLSNTLVYVKAAANAEVCFIENNPLNSAQGTANNITLIELAQNASVKWLREESQTQANAGSITACLVSQERDSRFEHHILSFGRTLGRHDLRVRLVGTGAECKLNGICVAQDAEHYDHHTCIEHVAAHCNSEENYRCIADDKAQIVFNGRIHIHRDAQKTLGEMNNKNLLLSKGAEINAKPELEIYADDVKCAHGTTIGQLDETSVYYLQTRGVTEAQARQMLTLGFVLELVNDVPNETVVERWNTLLADRLSFEEKA